PIGIDLQAWRNTTGVGSALRTQNGDIQIVARSVGSTSGGVGLSALAQDTTRRLVIAATGTGSVTIDSQSTGTSTTDFAVSSVDVLAASGDIRLTGQNTGLLFRNWPASDTNYVGSYATGLVQSSSSNIYFDGNKLDFSSPVAVKTTGAVYVQPFGASFSAAVSLPSTFTVNASATGFTLGKTTNTANITQASALTIDGPIRIYGGNITLNAALATTNTTTGDVLLQGAAINSAYDISVADTRALTLNNTGSSLFSGVISGTGASLAKLGAGVLTLTGTNTYTGGTSLDAASTLVVGNGTAVGALGTGNIVNDGVLIFKQSDAMTIADVIAGTGIVKQEGSGTLTLSATNSYAGGTQVNAGTLAISTDRNLGAEPASFDADNISLNGGTLQFTTGFTTLHTNRGISLAGNGTLSTDASVSVNYAGVIAGTGGLTKSGSGTLTLTSAQANTGTTTVSGGTLNVGDGSNTTAALGANSISIGAGATLNFNHSGNVTVANAIGGAGALNKLDTHTLTLTGVNSYTGATGTGSAGAVVYTNNTAPTTSGFSGSGAVTIQPATTSFGSLVIGNYNFATTLSGLTLGKAGNLTDLTLNSLVNIAGPITLYAPNITLNSGSISTTGGQTYNGAVILGVNTTLSSTASGDITFGSTLNGDKTLVVNTSGATIFTGAVGGATALTSLTTDATGTVAINGGSVRTSGTQSFGELLSLGAATTLTASGVTFDA
ncbi:MAG: hypothetical protein EB125_07205, partial [Betaproteobacteria bacterium]|nr:hypothetical protein [Betaproteobacteria bacterium]